MQAGEIIRLAKVNGINDRAVYRAKLRLRVQAKTTGFGKEKISTWRLANLATLPISPSISPISTALETGEHGEYDGEHGENDALVI